jgi:glycosyltransferase involved in cell wall biosynthesis
MVPRDKNSSIRVLLLCDSLDISGGVERFVCTLANHLAREGMDVALGSTDTSRESIPYQLDEMVRVLTGDRRRTMPEPAPGASGPARAWVLARKQWRIGRALGRIIRAERSDVVVLNGLTAACSALALDARFAARTICCDHNHFNARSAPWRHLRARLYPKVAALVSLTEADASAFRALNPRTEVIHNASSLRLERPPDVTDGSPVVLAIGRHVAQKGFDLLVRAWVDVAQAVPSARLRVVGDGALRAEHESLARSLGVADAIDWMAPTRQVQTHYLEAALFVLPSRYEGMPLVLLEAQAMGLPTVAFDCPTGPAEIITEHTGRLVPDGDVAALARAIIELLQSPALRWRMASAAIERSAAFFSPREHERRWTALVREVALRNIQGADA